MHRRRVAPSGTTPSPVFYGLGVPEVNSLRTASVMMSMLNKKQPHAASPPCVVLNLIFCVLVIETLVERPCGVPHQRVARVLNDALDLGRLALPHQHRQPLKVVLYSLLVVWRNSSSKRLA